MKHRTLAARVMIAIIRIYQYTLSPWVGRTCRFLPTCSHYGIEAIETHGAVRGGWLTLKRLLRCHPIRFLGGGSGLDPVPPPADTTTARD
ncbi:membrane protein insertion efficiency factor YidD [bacterium]|nr:membrane protein insertion efficiency factor YidD [bacterium]